MNTESPTEVGFYVYAVARARNGSAPEIRPLDGIVPDAPVFTVSCDNLLAVVSPIPLDEFRSKILEASEVASDWARAAVLGHQRVLARLMKDYTLIPFRFSSLYTTEERVREMLDRNRASLEEAITRLQEAVEWGVKLFCDRQSLVNWVQDNSETLCLQREAIARASAGAGYFLRKKSDHAAQAEAERAVDACVETSHAGLSHHARQAVTNHVQPAAAHGRRDDMVLNGAYLVDNSCASDFHAELASLEQRYAVQGFAYESTGPWPPYNFAAMDLVAS